MLLGRSAGERDAPMLLGMEVLTTSRLRLRRLTLGDTDPLLETLGDPEAMRHYPAPKTRDEVEGWIRWAMASCESFTWERTGSEMHLYTTDRDELAEPTLAERHETQVPPLPIE